MKQVSLTFLLAGMAMIGPFAIDTYLPSFHDIAADLGVSEVAVQQTLSVYLIALAGMTLILGPLTDALGRRRVALGGLAVFALASLAAAAAPDFGWLLAARALQGLSAGVGIVVGQAVIRDLLAGAEAHRLMANVMTVFGIAPAIAPVIGGQLVPLGWRSVFVLLFLLAGLLAWACWRWLPESLPVASRQPLHPRSMLANYGLALRHWRFVLGSLAAAFGFTGFAIYISTAANFVIEVLGLSAASFAWLFVPMIGGTIIGSAVSARLTTRLSTRRIIKLGLWIMAAGALINLAYAIAFPARVPWAVLPILIYSFGLSFARPGMSVITLGIFPRMRGLAAALQSSMQTALFALVSGAIAPLLFGSAAKMAAGLALGVALTIGCWLVARPDLHH